MQTGKKVWESLEGEAEWRVKKELLDLRFNSLCKKQAAVIFEFNALIKENQESSINYVKNYCTASNQSVLVVRQRF